MNYSDRFKDAVSVVLFTVVCLAGCSANNQEHEHHAEVLDGYRYTPSDTVQQDIDALLISAGANDKYAILVLGAQWCHDSVGLTEKFSTPQMQSILSEHYEVLFVDVGFLEDRRAVTRRFDYPSYFATPTVFVIEPVTGRLVNRSTIDKWGSADAVTLEEYVSYFTEHANKPVPGFIEASHPIYAQLETFSARQAERLNAGYRQLGPLLKSYEEGDKSQEKAFFDLWKEVRGFRFTLQSDLMSLRKNAMAQSDSKAIKLLSLPSYGPFSWEQR